MKYFITGGKRLEGEIRVSGNEQSSLLNCYMEEV